MDEDQIAKIAVFIPSIRNTFRGVLPKNQLPTNINNKECHSYILNYDKYGYPASHWVAFYIDHDHVFYFDSYGINPKVDPYIMNFANKCLRNKLFYSNIQLQSPVSSVCGLYCIYFLYIMNMKLYNFKDFVSLFDNNYKINDYNILSNFKDIFVKLNMNELYKSLYCNNS